MSPGQVMRIMESQALCGRDTKLKRKSRPIGFGGLAFWICEVLDIPIRVDCFWVLALAMPVSRIGERYKYDYFVRSTDYMKDHYILGRLYQHVYS